MAVSHCESVCFIRENIYNIRIIESATGGPAPYGIQIMQTLTGARSIGFFSFYCLGISRVHHTPQTLEEVKQFPSLTVI